MADIVDPVVTEWTNRRLRTITGWSSGYIIALREEVARYDADINPVMGGNAGTDPIIDGSGGTGQGPGGADGDGRPQLIHGDLDRWVIVARDILDVVDGLAVPIYSGPNTAEIDLMSGLVNTQSLNLPDYPSGL